MGVEKEILKQGDGKHFPQKGQRIQVHYVGTLLDGGAKFDSSRDRGRPFECAIGVGQVIRGWDEAFMQMSLGASPCCVPCGRRRAGAVRARGAAADTRHRVRRERARTHAPLPQTLTNAACTPSEHAILTISPGASQHRRSPAARRADAAQTTRTAPRVRRP